MAIHNRPVGTPANHSFTTTVLGEWEGEVMDEETPDDRTDKFTRLVMILVVEFTFHKPKVSKTKYFVKLIFTLYFIM